MTTTTTIVAPRASRMRGAGGRPSGSRGRLSFKLVPYIFLFPNMLIFAVVPRERLELVKNPDYWNPARLPKHDRLVLLPMPEATTRAAALCRPTCSSRWPRNAA